MLQGKGRGFLGRCDIMCNSLTPVLKNNFLWLCDDSEKLNAYISDLRISLLAIELKNGFKKSGPSFTCLWQLIVRI